MDGNALELALGLYRAPIQRFALLGRPLPSDIDAVIQLATGIQPQLRDAGASCGESEETILAAVRFYLQQMLFQPDADAYRVLGLEADAEAESIRRHYRWLQSWLHPDRRGEEWEALLATRVNWAWRHLRTEVARREYAAGGEARDAVQSANSAAHTWFGEHEWVQVSPVPRAVSWSRRIALGISLGSCLGLLVLAISLREAKVFDDFAPPETTRARRDTAIKPSAPDLQPIQEPVDLQVATAPASAMHDIEQGLTIAGTSDATLTPGQWPPIAGNTEEHELIPGPLAPVLLPKTPDIRPPSIAGIKPVWPAIAQVAESPQGVFDRKLPRVDSRQGGGEPLESRRIGAVNIEHRDLGAEERPSSSFISSEQADAVHTEEGMVSNERDSASSSAVANEPGSAGAAQAPSLQVAPGGAMGSEEALTRIDLARHRIGEVAAYLGNESMQPPPIWNDVRGQINAEQQRAALLDRNQSRAAREFEIETPIWRMSMDTAALSADYRLREGHSVSESGRIVMDMIWREKMWLVTRLELNPVK